MIASYLLNPGKPSHGMDALALEYLNHKTITYAEVTGSGKKQIGFADVDVQTATRYSGEDADITLRLKQTLAPLLREQNLETLFLDMEMPLMEVLAEMERIGVKINADFLKIMSKKLAHEMARIEKTIYELAGTEFNINSPKQLAEILFVKLKLTPTKKTKTGFSTNVDVLEELAPVHPLPAEILKYRTLSKLKSTYIDALPLDDQSENGQAPHLAQPDRDRDRQAFKQRSEPPEHPHTHRSRAGDQTGVHRRTAARACSRPITPRSSCASSPT